MLLKGMKRNKSLQTGQVCEFILKLLEIMKNHPDHVKWTEDGTQILFTHLADFTANVLPKYFRHSNLMSFVRQLNMYYFAKGGPDNNNEMIFQHSIFKRGNEQNYKSIERRNKTRDLVIESMDKNYSQTMEIIESDQTLCPKLKALVRIGIQYTEISEMATKKMKNYLNSIVRDNSTSRCKNIKDQNTKIRDIYESKITQISQKIQALQNYIREELCRDIKPQNNQHQIPPILSDQLGTCKDLPLVNFQSVNSLVHPSFQQSFGERDKQEDLDAQISIEQDLESYQKNLSRN